MTNNSLFYGAQKSCNYFLLTNVFHFSAEPTNCDQYNEECSGLRCRYGIVKSYDTRIGCDKCACNEPCEGVRCPEGYACVINDRKSQYEPECRQINKPGECPALGNSTSGCYGECRNDADCLDDKKCCQAGCSYVCTLPAEVDEVVTYPPGAAPPQLEDVPEDDLNIIASEGGVATLRCYATGFPPPSILWKKGEIEVKNNLKNVKNGIFKFIFMSKNS